MSKYIYKNPLDEGYKKFKLTKKQHNQLFKHKQIKWLDKYEYYINEDGVILHRFYNWKVIILNTIFFPIIHYCFSAILQRLPSHICNLLSS